MLRRRDTFYTLMERAMTNAPPALRSEGAVTGQFIVAANSGHMIHVSEPQTGHRRDSSHSSDESTRWFPLLPMICERVV
jgi:hypothetical protein